MAAGTFISLTVTPPLDTLELYRQQAQRFPALVTTRFRRLAIVNKRLILAKLLVEPGPVVYALGGKLRWKSRKQQRAFFASDGFGAGIPTERTGLYQDSFDVQVVTDDFGGFLLVTNSDPAARYIGGDDQQPFHVDTGYLNLNTFVADETERVAAILAADVKFLANPRIAA